MFGNNKECQSLNFYLNWHLSNKANMFAGCKLSSICQYQVYLCWCRNEWSLFNFHWHQMRKLHKENCNLSLQQCPFGKSMNEPLRLKYLPKLCITYILKDMYIFFFQTWTKFSAKLFNYSNKILNWMLLYQKQIYSYIPSPINIWKKVLTKAIWADKKWAGFWQISLYIK